MYGKTEEDENKELELTPQLMYRLYPERFLLNDDVSAEFNVEVKTLAEDDLKSEKMTERRFVYYDSESRVYK